MGESTSFDLLIDGRFGNTQKPTSQCAPAGYAPREGTCAKDQLLPALPCSAAGKLSAPKAILDSMRAQKENASECGHQTCRMLRTPFKIQHSGQQTIVRCMKRVFSDSPILNNPLQIPATP